MASQMNYNLTRRLSKEPSFLVDFRSRKCILQISRQQYLSVCQAGNKGFGAPAPSATPKPVPKRKPVQLPTENYDKVDYCSCNSGKTYKSCCQPQHLGSSAPNTGADATLRARFTAMVRGRLEYLLSTTHAQYHAFHYQTAPGEAQERLKADYIKGINMFDYANLNISKVEVNEEGTESTVTYNYQSSEKSAASSPNRTWRTTVEKGMFMLDDGLWKFAEYQKLEYGADMVSFPEPSKKA